MDALASGSSSPNHAMTDPFGRVGEKDAGLLHGEGERE